MAYAKGKWAEISRQSSTNLVAGGDCASLGHFTPWQQKRPVEGTFDVDSAIGDGDSKSIVLTGVHGCVSAFVRNRRAGGVYLVRALSRSEGDAGVGVSVSFLKDGKWNFKVPTVQIPAAGKTAAGWTEHVMTVEIPESHNGFGVKLGATLRRGQRVWFDNVSVHELSVTREACGR